MATLVSEVVAAVRDELRGDDLATYLADSQLSGIVGAAVALINGRVPNAGLAIADKVDSRVALTSSITPTIGLESAWGALLRCAVLYKLAESGALVRAEQNVGSYSAPSHSANSTSRTSQMRANVAMMNADLDKVIAHVTGRNRHAQAEVSYASWIA